MVVSEAEIESPSSSYVALLTSIPSGANASLMPTITV